MSRLLTRPPETVTAEGKAYPINTDFRVWIEIEELLSTLSQADFATVLAKCLALAYTHLPPSPVAALNCLLEFYSPGALSRSVAKSHTSAPPLYDIKADFEYIYSAFMSRYGIDLCEVQLHWWKFCALLSGLDDSCRFAKIVSYRGIDTHSIKDPEQRRFYEKMKRLYALPDNRTPEEREGAMVNSMECMF